MFSAYNGKEALKIINREDIQLVLMDIMMPKWTDRSNVQNP